MIAVCSRAGRAECVFLSSLFHHHKFCLVGPVGMWATPFADGVVKIIALAALGLVRDAVLQDLLILRSQRGLLSQSPRFRLVEGRLAPRPRTGNRAHAPF